MDWLSQQPLIQKLPQIISEVENKDVKPAYMSHAGISPQWTIDEALEQASNAQVHLSSSNRQKWLSKMYGESPNDWREAKTDTDKFRFTINTLTRMRYCFLDGTLEFNEKDSPDEMSPELKNILTPWFKLSKVLNNSTWIFGHWASLMGNCSSANAYALDTGCVWGNHLTMLRWHDKKIFTEYSHT